MNLSPEHQQNVNDCLDILQDAQSLVELAMQRLCPVPGFADQWSDLGKPYDAVKAAWHQVDSRRQQLRDTRPTKARA